MSLTNLPACSPKSVSTGLVAIAVAVVGWSWLTNGSPEAPSVAVAQSKSKSAAEKHDAAEHAADAAALKAAFSGAAIDLFFEPGEVESAKPGLSSLKFLDHVDVTGKELLRFEKSSGETWLIDPDTVFAFRARKGK